MANTKFKLTRPLENASGDGDISEVTRKEDKDVSASDFYSVTIAQDGTSSLGSMADAISNIYGLTSSQVASLHPKDFILMSGECSTFLL